MSWVAAAVVGGAVIGGIASNSAAKKQSSAATQAADTQAAAGKYATDAQTSMFNKINDQQAPWRNAGGAAVTKLSDLTQSGGLTNPIDLNFKSNDFHFNNQDLKDNLAPNYDFMLKQGLGAIQNQGSVSGGLVSGNALKGINDYAQNYAQNGYQQAFNNALTSNNTNYNQNFQNHLQSYNNFNTNQTNIFNRLAAIAGLGQTSTGQSAAAGTASANAIGNIATTTAGNIGSAQLYGGAAQAAGINGSANAISNGLNNAAGWYMANNTPPPIYQSNIEGSPQFIGPPSDLAGLGR